MKKKALYASDILKLRPGTVIACKCSVHFRILAIKGAGWLDAIDLGENSYREGRPNIPVSYLAEDMCLPMTLVSAPGCMFETTG